MLTVKEERNGQGQQYHICCKSGDVGRYVLLPGDPFRTDYIASFLDDARLVAHNREHRTWKKCKNVCSLLMPLFFSTVRRSTDLAMAMEARGYQEGAETTRMYPLIYDAADRRARILMWSCFGVLGALLLADRFFC